MCTNVEIICDRAAMKCLLHHRAELSDLAKVSSRQRKVLLQRAKKSLIKCLCEIALNTLKGNVPLNSVQWQRLKRHRHVLRYLALRKPSLSRKKTLLEGKGLPVVAPLVIPALSLVGKTVKWLQRKSREHKRKQLQRYRRR